MSHDLCIAAEADAVGVVYRRSLANEVYIASLRFGRLYAIHWSQA
jgi:hypothetical protein